MLIRFVFLSQVLSTLAMLGLIWFVQLVHYPLFLRANSATFAAFEAEHANRVSWIAGPLMVIELAGAAALLWPRLRPAVITTPEALLGLALVGVLWLSTVFLQIPLHNYLHAGYDRTAIQRLVTTNWLRTAAWTTRGILLCVWICRLMR